LGKNKAFLEKAKVLYLEAPCHVHGSAKVAAIAYLSSFISLVALLASAGVLVLSSALFPSQG
jgi:hypothetical protein